MTTVSPYAKGLSAAQAHQFQEDGFLHLPAYMPMEEVSRLRQRAAEIIGAFSMESVSIFSTNEQTQTSDAYFLDSADQSSCFFEEGAFDANGNLTKDIHVAINKIGHGMHDFDAVFKQVSYTPALLAIARSIGMQEPCVAQSMYIFKQPAIGGKVDAHQDGTFIDTRPSSVTGFWVALEDATISNGCLWAIPGSHKTYPVTQYFERDGEKGKTKFTGHKTEWDLSKMVPLEVKCGDMLLLHAGCVHMSHANTSPQSRHAYAMHLIDLQNTAWPAENWLQRPEGRPFTSIAEIVK
jgi:phytanoyl-CoA hydroxylase